MSDYKEFESKMKKTCEALTAQLATIRAGRANAAVLDQIQVDYYGVPTPIQQVASIATPDPRSLLIQPWDNKLLKGIEKAILSSELGINPQNDGRSIRLVFPPLTEERRRETDGGFCSDAAEKNSIPRPGTNNLRREKRK